jgi:biotin-dependent carboxylase-like uncharacterized protein
MIEITATSGLATVQDLGRYGSMRYGVGVAGAMDRLALAAANLLLGNEQNAAAIEIPMFPFTARFTADCAFALTGADCAARLAGRALVPWSVDRATAGDEFSLSPPRHASRAYVALPGGVDVPAVLGSRSTQLRGAFGGLQGRAIRNGDVLNAASTSEGPFGFGLVPPIEALPLHRNGIAAVRVLPAAEFDHFTPAAQAAFWSAAWKISADSNRYGYRLAGELLAVKAPLEMLSHGIVPGVIQVPPGGQPIIQMRDAQPSGGYPKFGTVIEADLWRLGQAPIGSPIRFIETNWAEAVAAADAVQAWLDEAARLIELRRTVWQ